MILQGMFLGIRMKSGARWMQYSAWRMRNSGVWLAVFAEQMCLPVPAVLLLMTAGALAARGDDHLHLSLVLVAGVAGSLVADTFWFWLGQRWGSRVIRLVCSFTSDPKRSRERARKTFDRWGLRLLVVAKFVPGLDGVAPPLAGAEGTLFRNFMLFDAVGSLLWTGAYVLLGFLFANQIEPIMLGLERFGVWLAVGIGVPLLLYVLWRAWHLLRVILHLRLRRISPTHLQARLDRGDAIAVFDLLNYEARMGVLPGIPGALRVDPTRLQNAPPFEVPDNVDVVLYCSSRNEFASARVAEALEKRRFTRVWVLEGGLQAWIEEGRPVTEQLSTREELAARLGIHLPQEMH